MIQPFQQHAIDRQKARKAAGAVQRYPQHAKPNRAALPPKSAGPCVHLGAATDATVSCQSCRGHVELKLFACAVHGTCTQGKRVDGHGCCDSKCKEREVK